ncbi:MAG: hypothetical protein JWM16_2506, partial [Verrucomicrobiales bacterium]|nr:hypothetical protein [Verrucomicrobiales bacterium]
KYRKHLDKTYAHLPRARRLLVSLTSLPIVDADSGADICLRWENVQRMIATTDDPSAFVKQVLKEFAAFLESKGLAPINMPKITSTLLASWHDAKRLEHSLAKVLEKLRTDPEINKITSFRQVNRADKNWIGISGQNFFWAGFCIKGTEMYMWVEITLPGDKRSLRRQLTPPLAKSFENATKYLEDWEDNDAVNRDVGDLTKVLGSRFVFAQSVNQDTEPDSERLFQWLYDTSLAVIAMATPGKSSKRG